VPISEILSQLIECKTKREDAFHNLALPIFAQGPPDDANSGRIVIKHPLGRINRRLTSVPSANKLAPRYERSLRLLPARGRSTFNSSSILQRYKLGAKQALLPNAGDEDLEADWGSGPLGQGIGKPGGKAANMVTEPHYVLTFGRRCGVSTQLYLDLLVPALSA
jgi:hypothetical protein